MTRTKGRFRQALLATIRDDAASLGHRAVLEVLKRGQKGPRRQGEISGEGAALVISYLCHWGSGTTNGMVLDWLEDNAELVAGLSAADVRAAVAEMRQRGGSFV